MSRGRRRKPRVPLNGPRGIMWGFVFCVIAVALGMTAAGWHMPS